MSFDKSKITFVTGSKGKLEEVKKFMQGKYEVESLDLKCKLISG